MPGRVVGTEDSMVKKLTASSAVIVRLWGNIINNQTISDSGVLSLLTIGYIKDR